MKNRSTRSLLAACVALCLLDAGSAAGQTFESIRKQFPDEKAVLLNRTLEYNINVKEDKPYVESRELQQIEYLLGSATAFMGGYSFYHSGFRQLVAYEAYTRTPDDKKLKVSDFKTTIDKENFVFYDDAKQTSFNFPAVSPGAIGNLEVSWRNTDPHLLGAHYFSGYMPVINSTLKITVSDAVSLKYKLMGLDTSNIAVSLEQKRHNIIYTFVYKNCPADKHYPDAPGFAWYSPHVVFYIDSYRDSKGVTIPYLSNTDDLYKLNYSFVKQINNAVGPQLKHIVDTLTARLTTPESKAKSIYFWVQHHVKYVAFEDGLGGFVPRDAGLVCSRRFGDCKDMASILTEMLNVAGVPAYFTWIGTRDLPYRFSSEPLPLVSNHMICAAKIDGKFIFLDGTDPTCVFGMPSAMTQGKEAMVGISEKEYKIMQVPVMDKGRNTETDTTWLDLTSDGLKGRIKKELTGYLSSAMYAKLLYWNDRNIREDMKDELERGSNKFRLDTFYLDRKPTTDQISVNANFTLPNYAKKIGNEYYLNLNLFHFFEHEEIDYPKRTVPIEATFKYIKKYVTMIKIPDGYKPGYIPQGKSFHNDTWGFDLKYEQKGNWIVLSQEFDNDYLMLSSDRFQAWNKVLENLLPLYKETLSLTKI